VNEHSSDRPGTRHSEKTDIITRRRFKRPPLYAVIFHNDDYTTRDFVVMVLMRYFHKSHAEASTLMHQVHTKGQGLAGVYPYDIANSKRAQVEGLAREHEMPLRVTVQPEDEGSEEND
jgi:ATP-dependent Clp protease adaptor protein ClpS